jgi:threonine/homoserine/homoserine lactone efflux protein
MLALLLPLVGFAFLDSLNVLNLGVTTAVVYDSRLSRRSPLPAGVSFIVGVLAATTIFGVLTVVGLNLLTDRVGFEVTPTVRYWGQLAVGLVLIVLAAASGQARGVAPPERVVQAARRNPWLFAIVGLAVGFGQSATSVPYLSALALISAHDPMPLAWPVLVLGYCAIALSFSVFVLALSTVRTIRARRVQRHLVRAITRYGPPAIRGLFLVVGVVLVVGALLNYRALF